MTGVRTVDPVGPIGRFLRLLGLTAGVLGAQLVLHAAMSATTDPNTPTGSIPALRSAAAWCGHAPNGAIDPSSRSGALMLAGHALGALLMALWLRHGADRLRAALARTFLPLRLVVARVLVVARQPVAALPAPRPRLLPELRNLAWRGPPAAVCC